MAIAHYLAMTAEEMAAGPLPQHAAWMACHFSPYSTGLCGMPSVLPEGSLLILNDRTPIHGHDPQRIAGELCELVQRFSCTGVLADFQNPKNKESEMLVRQLTDALPCPAAFSRDYAPDGAAIFLPPVPTDVPIVEYLTPWKDRAIWLETALEGQTIRLTRNGAAFSPNRDHSFSSPHADTVLHCHYSVSTEADAAVFRTRRTAEDLEALLKEAEALSVVCAIGLFQELHGIIGK